MDNSVLEQIEADISLLYSDIGWLKFAVARYSNITMISYNCGLLLTVRDRLAQVLKYARFKE
jgi:hypothetical protein